MVAENVVVRHVGQARLSQRDDEEAYAVKRHPGRASQVGVSRAYVPARDLYYISP